MLCVFPEKLLRDQTFRLSRLYVSVSVWSLVKCSKLVTITFQWPIGAAVLGLFQSVPYRVHRKYYVLLHIRQLQLCFISLNVFFCYFFVKSTKR